MNAVRIDVSKGKGMMAALQPMWEVFLRSKENPHTKLGLERMALVILALGGRIPGHSRRPRPGIKIGGSSIARVRYPRNRAEPTIL